MADEEKAADKKAAKKDEAPAATLTNTPEVAQRLEEELGGNNDAQSEVREGLVAALEENKAQADADHERALAMAAPIQKVTDGNETAALMSITGQRPVRDMTDAPPPNELGPHHEDAE